MRVRDIRIAAALAVVLMPTARTVFGEDHAEEASAKASLSVVGIQAGTGQRLPAVYFSLLDANGAVIVRDCANTYEGGTTLAVGTEIVVFAPGHDLRRLVLRPGQLRRVQMQLTPTTAKTRILSEVGPGIEDVLHAIVKHSLRGPGTDGALLFRHRYEVKIGKAGAEIAVPRGLTTVVLARGAVTDHVYPLVFSPKGGETVSIRAERMRQIPIKLGGGGRDGVLHGGRALPSYALPSGWPPGRVDALRRRLRGGLMVLHRQGRLAVNQVPPIHFHLLARIGDEPIYRYVHADRQEIDLTQCDEPVSITSIMVAGRAVPPGTVVAPGRLGHDAMARLATVGPEHLLRVGSVGEGDRRIAAADTYTIWNPVRGFAFASIAGSGLTAKGWETGTVTLRSRSGAALTGRCVIWQTLVGTWWLGTQPPQVLRRNPHNDKRSGFVDVAWKREGREGNLLQFVGVPAGNYRVNFEVTVTGSGTTHRASHSASCPPVRVSAADPHAVVFVD